MHVNAYHGTRRKEFLRATFQNMRETTNKTMSALLVYLMEGN